MSQLLIITDPTSRVLFVNETVRDTTGFTAAEVVGRRPGQLWGGNMERGFYSHMWETISRKKKIFHAVVDNKRKGGETYRESLHVAPINNAEGKTTYFIQLASRSFGVTLAEDFEKLSLDPSTAQRKAIHFFEKYFPSNEKHCAIDTLDHYLYTAYIKPTEERYAARIQDQRLFEGVGGDESVFVEIYNQYWPVIKQYFERRLSDGVRAQDFTQETFLRVYQKRSGIRGGNATMLTYLYRIAHNLLVDWYRVKNNEYELTDNIVANRECDDSEMEDEKIARAIASLSQGDRQILEMKYWQKLRITMIAKHVGKTENAVKLSLSRARRKLKKILE